MTKEGVRLLLNKYALRPKKYMGQNFLIKEKILQEIVDSLKIGHDDYILEIGPGLGNMTRFILEKNPKKTIAVEKDKNFCEILKKEFAKYIEKERLVIMNEDILKIDFENIIKKLLQQKTNNKIISNYKIIGNIPYYLTSNLIRKIFEKDFLPEKIILTIQKEVAKRICAKPLDMNVLALSIQIFAQPKILKYIKKSNFWPEPKVDSAIIELTPHKEQKYKLEPSKTSAFFKIVKASFGGKRKQIINTLSKITNLDKNQLRNVINSARIDEKDRPENLSLEKWIKLASSINQYVIK